MLMESRRPPWILPAIVLAQFAGTSVWFVGNAILPELQAEFGLGGNAVATITSAVQLGFIAGTLAFALLSVADRFSPRKVFLACAVLGALSNAAITLVPAEAGGLPLLVVCRFLTGFFLAGIYPVGMKIAASWYKEGLGGALGFLVGALVLGTALPHLVRGLGHSLSWPMVTLSLSAVAVGGGALMAWLVPDGPYHRRGTAFDPRAMLAIFSSPGLRASALGYSGHMWELYTFWALVPNVIAHFGLPGGVDSSYVGTLSFVVIAAGALGCMGGGILSKLVGSARVASTQLAASGLCCLLSPLALLLPLPALLAFLVFWGVVVAGDSPQFSALTAANAPRELVGSALTIVNCIGFSLTVLSIQLVSAIGPFLPMQWWFLPLALGPALGLLALRGMPRPP